MPWIRIVLVHSVLRAVPCSWTCLAIGLGRRTTLRWHGLQIISDWKTAPIPWSWASSSWKTSSWTWKTSHFHSFPGHFQIGSQPSCQVDGAKALAEAQTSTCFWLDIWLDLCDFLLEQDLVRVSCYILSVYCICLYCAWTSDLCFPFWPATIHRPWWQGLVHNSHLEHLARNSDISSPATGWSCRGMDVQPLFV